MGEKNNYLDKQTDRRLCGGAIWKRGFWIKIGAIVIVTLFCLVLVGSFIYLKGCVSHTLSAIPNGVNISFYDGIDSRGFSWWTEKEQETFLFMSKTEFDAVKVYESRSYTIIEDGSAIKDGIYLLKGTSKKIEGNTRLDNIFAVGYVNHTVAVDNLQLNQEYYYSVGGNKYFMSGAFITESDNKTVVCNFNDFQTSDGKKLSYGAKTLASVTGVLNLQLDFYAFGGDFSGTFSLENKRYNQYLGWVKSRESLKEIIQSTPLVMAKGNHDNLPYLFESNNYANYRDNKGTEHYYSFDYNNVHFTVVDSNNFSLEQQVWIKQDLSNVGSDILWKVVMVHNGPYTTGDHGFNYNSEYVKAFSGICSTYEVDLVLQAHDHTYSKTYPYLWGTEGYYENEEVAEEIVNFYSTKYEAGGIIYDYQPNGTYYVSCGAAGHRIGENKKYAESVGEKSYINRGIKIAIDSLNVNSVYGTVGEKSSADLGLTMFGLLNIEKNKLIYSFYVVNEQGVAVLYDQLAIMK